MANIIDSTYFINDILIPTDSGMTGVVTNLNHAIVKTQEEVLRSLLGDTLYYHYTEGTATYSAFFTALIEGTTYDYDTTKKIVYKGLRGNDTTKQDSCLAYFTFANYVRDLNSKVTQQGVQIASSENSRRENPSAKIGMAHSKGLFLYGWRGNKWSMSSAYNFILNGGYYDIVSDIWDFTEIESINFLGI